MGFASTRIFLFSLAAFIPGCGNPADQAGTTSGSQTSSSSEKDDAKPKASSSSKKKKVSAAKTAEEFEPIPEEEQRFSLPEEERFGGQRQAESDLEPDFSKKAAEAATSRGATWARKEDNPDVVSMSKSSKGLGLTDSIYDNPAPVPQGSIRALWDKYDNQGYLTNITAYDGHPPQNYQGSVAFFASFAASLHTRAMWLTSVANAGWKIKDVANYAAPLAALVNPNGSYTPESYSWSLVLNALSSPLPNNYDLVSWSAVHCAIWRANHHRGNGNQAQADRYRSIVGLLMERRGVWKTADQERHEAAVILQASKSWPTNFDQITLSSTVQSCNL